MRITSVHASNFLSFLPDRENTRGLHLTDMPRDITLLVGPNSAGKTNVLRVIDTILQALKVPAFQGVPETALPHSHYPHEATKLRLGICLDQSDEQELLRLAWINALADFDNHFLSGLVRPAKRAISSRCNSDLRKD